MNLYKAEQQPDLDECRFIIYNKLISKSPLTTGFELQTLPPNSAASQYHVFLTVQQWLCNEISAYAWCWQDRGGWLVPVETDNPVAPDNLCNAGAKLHVDASRQDWILLHCAASAMMRIVPIWRYSCLRCDLIECVKWYVNCLILHKYGKMTNILCSKDNNFHSIGLLNPRKHRCRHKYYVSTTSSSWDITFIAQKLLLRPSWRPSWVLKFAQVGFQGTFDMLFVGTLWTYSEKLACYEFCSPPTLMLLDYMAATRSW